MAAQNSIFQSYCLPYHRHLSFFHFLGEKRVRTEAESLFVRTGVPMLYIFILLIITKGAHSTAFQMLIQ
jgi:hypothetical protein